MALARAVIEETVCVGCMNEAGRRLWGLPRSRLGLQVWVLSLKLQRVDPGQKIRDGTQPWLDVEQVTHGEPRPPLSILLPVQ